METFAHPDLLKSSWNDIIRSIALEGFYSFLSGKNPNINKNKADTEIREFLKKVVSNLVSPDNSPGKGKYIRSQSNNHEGGILMDDAKLVHLSAFKTLK